MGLQLTADNTIYWYDFETFGGNPFLDRPCQFAGLRTDEDLNPIDEPLVLHCQPAPDFLPHPEACLITGIAPQQAQEKGLSEKEFCDRLAEQFSRPHTCVSGYNSIRFDDEMTRRLLYRCFHDPYRREWQDGNSRWDLIDLARMAQALRPQGINWPRREDGAPSFKLEDLATANGLEQGKAHDALEDVKATVALARLIKREQPRLYDFLYRLRDKRKADDLLDLREKTMLLHASRVFPAARGCLAAVMPIVRHPRNKNGVIVYDLSQDPALWLDLDVEELKHRLFAPGAELEEHEERIGLKTVHLNKCPALAPLSVLKTSTEESRERLGLDLEACARHRDLLLRHGETASKVRAAFDERERKGSDDPDLMLYSGGFFDDGDRALMDEIRLMQPEKLVDHDPPFKDPRLPEMLFRYRARNYPQTLNAEETERWRDHCRRQLREGGGAGPTVKEFFACLEQLEAEAGEAAAQVLAEVRSYGETLCARLDIAP